MRYLFLITTTKTSFFNSNSINETNIKEAYVGEESLEKAVSFYSNEMLGVDEMIINVKLIKQLHEPKRK